MKVTTFNLSTHKEHIYHSAVGCDFSGEQDYRIRCLIVSAMLEHGKASSIHNPVEIDAYRAKVVLGKRTASIGDWCVLMH